MADISQEVKNKKWVKKKIKKKVKKETKKQKRKTMQSDAGGKWGGFCLHTRRWCHWWGLWVVLIRRHYGR